MREQRDLQWIWSVFPNGGGGDDDDDGGSGTQGGEEG